jgi:quercetin dioxygenase-like cupin family protein
MPRTNYRSQTTFTVPSQGSVSLPPLRPLSPNHEVYITFPITSKIATGLHWHETHTEYLQIIQGVALVTLGDSTERYTAQSGVITIPRYTVHEYRRADSAASKAEREAGEEDDGDGRDVDLIIKEWTDPADGEKAIFFRNVVGLILDRDPAAGTLQNLRTAWNLFVVFWEWDNFPRFVKMPRLWGLGNSVERRVTWAILGTAALIGRWVGVRGAYEEYGTKEDLRP